MYDYFQRLWANREKAVTVGIIVAFLLLAVCWFSYVLGIRNTGTDVSDNGIRIDDVRNELSTAQEHQRQITDGLAGAVERSDTATERAERIEERAVKSETAVNDAGKLLDECQQIIGNVRNRGKTGTTSH